jgi:ABC-type multidrug transport system fused ATPase/permease subunit
MSVLRNTWHLLLPAQRRGALGLLVLMLIGMLLETLGIGLVIPAIGVMTQDDVAVRLPAVAAFIARFATPTRELFVVFGMAVLVGVYAIKALFLAFLALRQMRFVNEVQATLSRRLFEGYLRQPYTFHLQHNSANLIRNAMQETTLFAQTALMASLTLLTEALVVVGILTLLLVVQPFGALLVGGVLGFTVWIFQILTHGALLRWGAARHKHDGQRIQHLQQGLGGVRDVKLMGRERSFIAQYEIHNRGTARANQRLQTLQQLPRLLLEFLAVAGLSLLVFVMVWRGQSLDLVLPTIALFGAAAFRLLPSANRMMGAIQNVRYALPVVDVLHAEITSLSDEPVPVAGPRGAVIHTDLALDNVRFTYPSASRAALDGVSLRVARGTTVGFIGGSGAGKTTLVDLLLGLLAPDSGRVLIDDVDIRQNLRGWQDQIGYVPQSVFLTDDSLRRNVAFGLPDEEVDDALIWRALESAQLAEFIRALPGGLDTLVGERGVRLSGGQLQRVGIARALYHDPPVLVLDEATSALDTATENEVMRAVEALHGDKTVLIVAHRLSTVERCDRIFRMADGRIVATGAPGEVIAAGSTQSSLDTGKAG